VTLTPGMRAVSIRSDDVSGVAGFVLPGDRVDILLTRSFGGAPITQVLAENAQVVGVDQQSDTQADKPMVAKAVTVEVSPEQAQIISLAHAIGSISFTLRQISDHDPLGRKVTTVAQLGGPGAQPGIRARPRVRPAARPMLVRVTRGVLTTDYPVGGS
jgi:pilus assembly protein CpaB